MFILEPFFQVQSLSVFYKQRDELFYPVGGPCPAVNGCLRCLHCTNQPHKTMHVAVFAKETLACKSGFRSGQVVLAFCVHSLLRCT